MKPGWAYIVAVALCLGLSVYSLIDASEAVVYEGIYDLGFEDSTFKPCRRAEAWTIITGDEEAVREFARRTFTVTEQGNNPMYVRLRGRVSRKGRYDGLFTTYDRQLAVTEVLEVRPIEEGDCQ